MQELIEKCKKNDRNAQSELFKKYKNTLYVLSLKYCRNEADAQDNLQDAFMTIFEKIKSYKGYGSFEGWMKRITIYKAIDRYKNKKKVSLPIQENLIEETTIDSDVKNIPLEILLRFIQELPDQYRITFNLFQLDGYSHKDISKMLGVSENTSKTNHYRAKLQLKQKVINYQKQLYLNKNNYE